MANHISHASLPYPIRNARFTVLVPYLDADGDPTDPTTPDTEVSQDGGAFADAAEEVTTITGSNGSGYITLSGAEMNNSAVAVAFKVASGPKATLANLYPRNLPILESGTAGAGASGSITLASGTYTGLDLTNCFVRTTGGTGGGGTGGANNQARRITAYNTSTRVATVTPNWETTPDNTTTYDILLPEGVMVPMITALRPTTLARTLDVSAGGEAGLDWANIGSPTTTVNLSGTTVKTATDVETDTADIQTRIPAALGANGNIKADVRDFNGTAGTFSGGIPDVNTVKLGGTTQTARDIGQSVLLSSGTGTGQLDFTSGRVKADTVYFGGAIGTFANGVPSVAPNLIRYNTAQGGTASSITLDAAASFEDHHVICWIVKGTGGRQVRLGKSWNNTTKVLEVTPDWTTAPDNTSCFAIEAIGPANVTEWIGVPVATPTVAGVPEVDVTHWRGGAVPNNAITGVPVVDLWYLNTLTEPVDIAGGFFGGYGATGDIYLQSLTFGLSLTSIDMTKINSIPAAIRANTAQAGASGTITLDASASAVNDFYNGALIYLTGGTGAGQYAIITDYVGATKVASILPSWRTTPNNTTTFAIYPEGMVDLQSVGLTRGYEPSVPGAVFSNLYYINDFGDGVGGLSILGDDYYTDGVVYANLAQVGGNPLAATTAGYVPADVRYIVGASVNTGTAQLGVNVVSAGGVTWASGSITSGVVAASAATEIAQAVLTEAASAPIASDVKKINSVTVDGAGTAADPWGPV